MDLFSNGSCHDFLSSGPESCSHDFEDDVIWLARHVETPNSGRLK